MEFIKPLLIISAIFTACKVKLKYKYTHKSIHNSGEAEGTFERSGHISIVIKGRTLRVDSGMKV